MKTLILITLLIPSLLFSFHKHENKESTHNDSTLEKTLNSVENKLKVVYDKLNITSKHIDEFITNEYDETIYTKSYIRIETTLNKTSKTSIDIKPDLDIKIKLPKLKEKLSLTISNKDDKVVPNFQDSNEKVDYEDNKYSAGLLYNTIKKDLDLKFRVGVKFSTNPYIFTKAEAKKEFNLNFRNKITLTQKLKYTNKDQLDNTTSFRYIYKINSKLNFSSYNEYNNNSKDKDNNMHSSLRINKKLSNRSYINYVTSIKMNDKDSNFKIKKYNTYISYRKYIRSWLYYDIVPNISWEEIDNFKESYGMRIRLGLLISE